MTTMNWTATVATLVPTSGLVARWEGNEGTTVSNGVSAWQDSVGSLTLTPPDNLPGIGVSPTGLDTVEFDPLEGMTVSGVGSLPTGAAARTLVFAFRPRTEGGSFAGFGYGTNAASQAFTISFNPSEIVQLDYFNSASTGFLVTDGWQIVFADYDGTTARLWDRTTLVDSDTIALNTGSTQINMCRSFSGNTTELAVAVALAYDRVLTTAERADIVSWIDSTYLEDTTPPALSALSLSNPTSVSLDWSFTLSKPASWWLVVTDNSTQPSAAQIKAGEDHTGVAADYSISGSNAVVEGTETGAATSLSASTTYYQHVHAEDSGARTDTESSTGVATDAPDTTAPTFSISSVSVETTTATVNWTTDEGNGTYFATIQATEETDASVIIAAPDDFGNVTATGAQSFPISGQAAETTYWVNLVHRDAAGNFNATAQTAQFTTNAAVTGDTLSFYGGETTITLNGNYEIGNYYHPDVGQYVVRPPGGSVGFVSATPVGSGGRNGAMWNPASGADGQSNSGQVSQGYDSTTTTKDFTAYSAAKNVDPDQNGATYTVSTEGSFVKADAGIYTGGDGRGQLIDSYAIVTVVDSAPPANAFRPGMHQSSTTSRAHIWVTGDADLTKVASGLVPTVSPTPDTTFAGVIGWVRRPQAMHHFLASPLRTMNPGLSNQKYISQVWSEALCLAMTTSVSSSEREQILYGLVQLGIDIYERHQAGGITFNNGAIGQCFKMPVVVAGTLLNDAGIQALAGEAPAASGSNGTSGFSTDQQIWEVTQADVGRTATGPRGGGATYIQADVGMSEWGAKHASLPSNDTRDWDNSSYRQQNSIHQIGNGCAMNLITGARAVWNWEPYFNYTDRITHRTFYRDDASGNSTLRTQWGGYDCMAEAMLNGELNTSDRPKNWVLSFAREFRGSADDVSGAAIWDWT